jgi:hypothetical protein
VCSFATGQQKARFALAKRALSVQQSPPQRRGRVVLTAVTGE